MPKAKATAGERFAARYFGWHISQVRASPNALATLLDREFAKRDAKVAEDVLAMLEVIASDWPHWHQENKEEVRAKYGKGPR